MPDPDPGRRRAVEAILEQHGMDPESVAPETMHFWLWCSDKTAIQVAAILLGKESSFDLETR